MLGALDDSYDSALSANSGCAFDYGNERSASPQARNVIAQFLSNNERFEAPKMYKSQTRGVERSVKMANFDVEDDLME